MKVVIGDQQYSVRFRHTQEGGPAKFSKLGKVREEEPLVRNTECKILQPIEGQEIPGFISIGYARCHPNDNFSKEKGRQYSLKKSLEDGNFTKEQRAIFWEEYRTYGTFKDSVTTEEGEVLIPRNRF